MCWTRSEQLPRRRETGPFICSREVHDNLTESNMTMTEKEQAAFSAIPQPAEGVTFHVKQVVTRYHPHPYCISARHVKWAADHHSGMLNSATIESAEQVGIGCYTCRQNHENLAYGHHTAELTLLIAVPVALKTLDQVAGLHAYLLRIKDAAEAAGIVGIAFPHHPA
jgi:hypothetical protein